jgi:hypothetical protein
VGVIPIPCLFFRPSCHFNTSYFPLCKDNFVYFSKNKYHHARKVDKRKYL